MNTDTRVLLYKHGGLAYALDYIPLDAAGEGACSLDRWWAVYAPMAIDLGIDVDVLPNGFSIFEGHFDKRVGAVDVIVVAYGTYRGLTGTEAQHLAHAAFTFAYPNLGDADDFCASAYLQPPPWLAKIRAEEEAEVREIINQAVRRRDSLN